MASAVSGCPLWRFCYNCRLLLIKLPDIRLLSSLISRHLFRALPASPHMALFIVVARRRCIVLFNVSFIYILRQELQGTLSGLHCSAPLLALVFSLFDACLPISGSNYHCVFPGWVAPSSSTFFRLHNVLEHS